jgi:hypothetical protein
VRRPRRVRALRRVQQSREPAGVPVSRGFRATGDRGVEAREHGLRMRQEAKPAGGLSHGRVPRASVRRATPRRLDGGGRRSTERQGVRALLLAGLLVQRVHL